MAKSYTLQFIREYCVYKAETFLQDFNTIPFHEFIIDWEDLNQSKVLILLRYRFSNPTEKFLKVFNSQIEFVIRATSLENDVAIMEQYLRKTLHYFWNKYTKINLNLSPIMPNYDNEPGLSVAAIQCYAKFHAEAILVKLNKLLNDRFETKIQEYFWGIRIKFLTRSRKEPRIFFAQTFSMGVLSEVNDMIKKMENFYLKNVRYIEFTYILSWITDFFKNRFHL